MRPHSGPGLTAESQRASYAQLLGGLDTVMPEVNDPGCPPPAGVDLPKNCTPRDPQRVSAVVAVPGAKVRDVLNTTDARVADPDPQLYDPAVYRAILWSRTIQLEAAVARQPRFATMWIGSNAVRLPTLRGWPDQATLLTQQLTAPPLCPRTRPLY